MFQTCVFNQKIQEKEATLHLKTFSKCNEKL
jgi:hypothetical protein